jgi:hypothetical protein
MLPSSFLAIIILLSALVLFQGSLFPGDLHFSPYSPLPPSSRIWEKDFMKHKKYKPQNINPWWNT